MADTKNERKGRTMEQTDLEFVAYLEETLIPDLKESGHDCTAEDFERCVDIIKRLTERGT